MFNSSPSEWIKGDPTASAGSGRGFSLGRWHGRASGLGEVKGELPASTLALELETPGEGQARAMFIVACNPVRSFPNSERIDAALSDLDLLVCVDPYITATSRHADVILPPRSALERSHYDIAFERNMTRAFAKYSPPVFATEAPDEPEILARLALVAGGFGADADPLLVQHQMLEAMVDREVGRAGGPIEGRNRDEILAELDAWTWAEQIIDFRLRTGRFGDAFGTVPDGLTLRRLIDDHPHGADLGPMVRRFPGGLKTPSGCVELWSDTIASEVDRLLSEPVIDLTDQLLLIGRRDLRSCNTWMHNVDVLIKGRERCTLLVHPDDAARLSLDDGQSARIASRVGTVDAPVEISDEMMPGVVCLPFGWGYDEPGIEMHTARTRPGVNSNALTDDDAMDPVSGNASLNAIPVTVTSA